MEATHKQGEETQRCEGKHAAHAHADAGEVTGGKRKSQLANGITGRGDKMKVSQQQPEKDSTKEPRRPSAPPTSPAATAAAFNGVGRPPTRPPLAGERPDFSQSHGTSGAEQLGS